MNDLEKSQTLEKKTIGSIDQLKATQKERQKKKQFFYKTEATLHKTLQTN